MLSIFKIYSFLSYLFRTSSSVLYQKKKFKMNHQFWKTQPVIHGETDIPLTGQPIAPPKSVSDVQAEPYPLPSSFEWWTPDLTKDEDVQAIQLLLQDNYVEDAMSRFRFKYSCDFLRWALMPPGYIREWNVAVRRKDNKMVLGFIAGVPINLFMGVSSRSEESSSVGPRRISEINFLCVHKLLRVKRLAPILIKEVTRRINLHDIWQAVYTAGVELPTPFSIGPYYHRTLNPEKLVSTGFSSIPLKLRQLRNPMHALTKYLDLPKKPITKNLRLMEERDAPQIAALLNSYMRSFDVVPYFSEEDARHQFVPREDIVYTYVVENDGKITDFFSFFSIPSSIIGHEKYSQLNVAYIHYYAHTETPLVQLINDLLIIAKEKGFDVCNVVAILHSSLFIPELKFNPGDASLKYYFYNWAYPTIKPNKVGLVML